MAADAVLSRRRLPMSIMEWLFWVRGHNHCFLRMLHMPIGPHESEERTKAPRSHTGRGACL